MSDSLDHTIENPNVHESYDVNAVRQDFPILSREVHGLPMVYLDNAATTQKPQAVVDALVNFYTHKNANVHRGIHTLSQEASADYEETRRTIQHFINARSEKEIIFTTGTTGAINLVSTALSRGILKPDDEIIVSGMEHHSNIVPWQIACQQSGASLRHINVKEDGTLDLRHFRSIVSGKTRLVSVAHTSNAMGTINPLDEIISIAHDAGAEVFVDGAQAIPHGVTDVQKLDADYFAFSSHKVYGPTGFGVLYAKESVLETLPPYQGGGDMIETVSFSGTTYNDLPHKFEAGTPNIAGAIGFEAALKYVSDLGMNRIQSHEQDLVAYATSGLESCPDVRIIGKGAPKASVISFLIGDTHPYDAGTFLDRMGIQVRTGHHCAMPLMTQYEIPGTIRASFGLYNTRNEIDKLVEGVDKVRRLLA